MNNARPDTFPYNISDTYWHKCHLMLYSTISGQGHVQSAVTANYMGRPVIIHRSLYLVCIFIFNVVWFHVQVDDITVWILGNFNFNGENWKSMHTTSPNTVYICHLVETWLCIYAIWWNGDYGSMYRPWFGSMNYVCFICKTIRIWRLK